MEGVSFSNESNSYESHKLVRKKENLKFFCFALLGSCACISPCSGQTGTFCKPGKPSPVHFLVFIVMGVYVSILVAMRTVRERPLGPGKDKGRPVSLAYCF